MIDLQYAQQYPLQTTAFHAPWLFGLALDAPLMGVLQRWPDKLHAVEMESVIHGSFGRGTFESACGLKGLRLVGTGSGLAAPWPPRLKGLAPKVRCQDCYVATGRMRPRTELKPSPMNGVDEF